MTGPGMQVIEELIWQAAPTSQGRARVMIDHNGDRFLSLSHEYPAIEHLCLVSLAGYEQLEPGDCLQAAPLAGVLAALDRARVEFGAAALLVGQCPPAPIWLRALGWRGCVPLHQETSLSVEAQEKSTAGFLDKVERPVVAVETSGDGTAVEILVRLLRRGDHLLLVGGRESEVTLYAYRDVHKKGITLLGVDPYFKDFFGREETCRVFVRRALNLLAWRDGQT